MASSWRWGIAGLLLAASGAVALAGEHYTEYVYDLDGRVQQITTAVDEAPPVVTSLAPGIVRRGPPVRVTVLGSSLRAAQVSTDDPGLGVSAVTATATKLTFDLTVAESVLLGAHVLTFYTVLGEASAQVTVRPRLPVVLAVPNPLAVAPGWQVPLVLRLGSTDVIDHTLQLQSSNPAVATVAPGSVVIPAGALAPAEAVHVTAHTLGTAALRIDSDEIRDVAVPLFVTAPYQLPPGGASFHSLLLGLQLGAPPVPPVLIERGPFATRLGLVMPLPTAPGDGVVAPLAAPVLGLSVGRVVTSLVPQVLVRGAGVSAVTALGVGLQDVTQVDVMPSDGVVASVLSAEPGSVALQIDAAIDASPGLRTLRLLDAADGAVGATADADRLMISDPLPQIDSVSPQLLMRGAGAQVLTVRGRLLAGATAVSVLPPGGVIVGSQSVVSPDGRTLTVGVSATADAVPGPRTLQVTTPAGTSDVAPTPANTLRVVGSIASTASPIAAAQLGLVLEGGQTSEQGLDLRAPLLGLSVGPVFTGIAPQARSAGSALVLQVFGHGLETVTAVALEPDDGIVMGVPQATPDGTSLSLPLTIAASAPRSLRRVSVLTAAGSVAPASPSTALFRVTDAVPEVDSVSPLVLVRGAAASVLTLRGRNFAGATGVAVTPSAGISVGPPLVAPDAQSLTVTVAASMAALPGARVVTVSTPAGTSDAVPSSANRLQVADGIARTVAPLASAMVGVHVDGGGQGDGLPRLFAAPLVGLTVGGNTPAPSVPRLHAGASVGIVVGAAVRAVSPRYLPINTSAQLQIDGIGLQGVDAVSVEPSQGVSVDASPQVAADGRSVTVALSIDPGAAQGPRRIVASASGVAVPESDGGAAQVRIVGNAPLIASIEPIQVVPGQAFVLTVRGINLFGTTAVTATPATGLSIGSNPAVNADGTQVTVAVNIAANAPAGPRAIRVIAGGGSTSPDATPANTLNVVLDD